jgi:type IX secretion system PorP/SprF family membrane protein
MKRTFLLPVLLIVFLTSADAQQEPRMTQFMLNKLAYNPATAVTERPRLTAMYRNQWMGFEGAPTLQSLSFSRLSFNNRVGLGLNLVRNTVGIFRSMTAEGSFAYRVPVAYGYLSAGIQFSVRNIRQNWNDPRLVGAQQITTDNAIPGEARSATIVDGGVGFYYQTNNWYAGIAVPRLARNSIDLADVIGEKENISREVRHWNFMGGYDFQFDENFTLTPQILVKYAAGKYDVGSPFDADINLSALLYQRFYGGLTYRHGGETNGFGESLAALAGMQATENIFFCLSYDITMTRLRRYSSGSIEALVRYSFGEEQIDQRDVEKRPWDQ